jgi:uncharacterized protein (TIGR03000 family)
MTRRWIVPVVLASLGVLLEAAPGQGWPSDGSSNAINLGPYTGGHVWSYNEAYGYGFAPSFADTWRYDPYAYRPYYYPYSPPVSFVAYLQTRRVANHPNLQPVPEAQPCTLQVRVPSEADVWVEGEKTSQTGPQREFSSPPLQAGKSYTYIVRARWVEAGREVEQFKPVTLQAGGVASVSFLARHP